MPPTELDLDRLEELAAKATSGPWEVQDPPLGYLRIIANVDCEIVGDPPRYKPSYDHIADLIDIDGDQANADLIVALRNALPAILAKLREGERAEELNAASHDMLMKTNARLTAERDAAQLALAEYKAKNYDPAEAIRLTSEIVEKTAERNALANAFVEIVMLSDVRLPGFLQKKHADALAIARRVAG